MFSTISSARSFGSGRLSKSARLLAFSQNRAVIPKGFCNKAQGCEQRATLGNLGQRAPQPRRGCADPLVGVIPYAEIVAWPVKWHNSFGVERHTRPVPRVARSSQPWAGGHNPFGL